jgi:hypothetical protein
VTNGTLSKPILKVALGQSAWYDWAVPVIVGAIYPYFTQRMPYKVNGEFVLANLVHSLNN